VQLETEIGHDPEIPAAAAHGPEEILVFVDTGAKKAAVGCPARLTALSAAPLSHP
jgi:hypothetical protein